MCSLFGLRLLFNLVCSHSLRLSWPLPLSFHPHSLTKPGLSFGNATITLPTITPQLALKLAQLGINVPTPQLGLKKATIGATLPMPDVQLAQRAINLTLPVPDIGMKQFGLNLTVPDIQLPRLELNVSGMPQVRPSGCVVVELARLMGAALHCTAPCLPPVC